MRPPPLRLRRHGHLPVGVVFNLLAQKVRQVVQLARHLRVTDLMRRIPLNFPVRLFLQHVHPVVRKRVCIVVLDVGN